MSVRADIMARRYGLCRSCYKDLHTHHKPTYIEKRRGEIVVKTCCCSDCVYGKPLPIEHAP